MDRIPIAIDIETEGLEAVYSSSCKFHCAHMYCEELDLDKSHRTIEELHNTITFYTQSSFHPGEFIFVFHNASFDVSALRTYGVHIQEDDYTDTMGIAYCIEPDEFKSLDHLSQKYLGDRKKSKPSFTEYSEEMAEYCRKDTILTYRLYKVLLPILQKDKQAWSFWLDIEKPYIGRIIEMTRNGAYIDDAAFQLEYSKTEQEFNELRKEMRKIQKRKIRGSKFAVSFNPDSSSDIADALMFKGWEPKEFTKTGKVSTTTAVLKKIANKYPLAAKAVEYRRLQIYFKTFLNAIKNRKGDYVHGSFNQFRVRTGRLSSSNPNLQNVPARDERGASIRRLFTAPPGYDVVVGDLDRIELVVLAFYLECVLGYDELANQIRQGVDVHSKNASRWHNVSEDKPDFKMKHRKPCKNGIFALVYGAGVTKFANTISIPVSRCKELIKSDPLLVAVDELRQVIISEAMSNDGVIHNFFGRRLVIPELLSKDKAIQASGKRKCFNYMIQGTAGDIFKYLQNTANTKFNLYLTPEERGTVKQILVVHDEAMYYVTSEQSQDVANMLTSIYSDKELLTDEETGVNLPISCEFNVGTNWWEAKGD